MANLPSPSAGGRLGQDFFELRLANALLARGLLTQVALEEALRQQVVLGGQLATNLWELRFVDGKTLTELSAELLRVPVADPRALAKTPLDVRRLFSRSFVEQCRILPIRLAGSVIHVATAEPWDLLALGRAAHHSGHPVEPYFLPEVPLSALLDKLYDIPTGARFWWAVEHNERRGKAKRETKEQAASVATRPQSLLQGFVSAEIAKLRSSRRGAFRPLIVEPPTTPVPLPKPPSFEPISDIGCAEEALAAAAHRDEVGAVLLRFALGRGRRALLFVRRSAQWSGWMGAGKGVDPAKVTALLVPSLPDTIFGLVADTGGHFLGPLTPHVAYAPLILALGGGRPQSVAFLPVYAHGRVVFGVYVDGGANAYLTSDISEIILLAQRVPAALERLVKARAEPR